MRTDEPFALRAVGASVGVGVGVGAGVVKAVGVAFPSVEVYTRIAGKRKECTKRPGHGDKN